MAYLLERDLELLPRRLELSHELLLRLLDTLRLLLRLVRKLPEPLGRLRQLGLTLELLGNRLLVFRNRRSRLWKAIEGRQMMGGAWEARGDRRFILRKRRARALATALGTSRRFS